MFQMECGGRAPFGSWRNMAGVLLSSLMCVVRSSKSVADEFVGLSNCQKNERTQTENTRESLPVVSSVTEINSSLSHPPNQPNPDRRQPSKFQVPTRCLHHHHRRRRQDHSE